MLVDLSLDLFHYICHFISYYYVFADVLMITTFFCSLSPNFTTSYLSPFFILMASPSSSSWPLLLPPLQVLLSLYSDPLLLLFYFKTLPYLFISFLLFPAAFPLFIFFIVFNTSSLLISPTIYLLCQYQCDPGS